MNFSVVISQVPSRISRRAFGTLFVVWFCVINANAADDMRPNVVVIYTDDQGYGDLSALNPESKFQTPNLDRLAREGVAFTNAHSADSVCTPSRYGLLTGRYPWRTAMKRGVMGAEGTGLIADGRMTIASMLRDQGYATAMVGKWHLGMDFPGQPGNRDWSKPTIDMPLDKGFDYFYGIPASLNYGILAWFENRHAAVPPTQYTNKKPNERHSDYRIMPPYDDNPAATKQTLKRRGFEVAEDFIDNQCLTRITDKAIEWMQQHVSKGESEQPFFLYLPYTSPHFPVCPLPRFHGLGDCGPYGEFVIETDFHVGRVLEFLDDRDLGDETIVIFTSDNGPENPWREHLDDFGHDSRGGFRAGKRSVYEGGHRVPFLVRWPGGIQSPGRRIDELVGQIDVLATLAEIVGAEVPKDAAEDSISFAPLLRDPDAMAKRRSLINHANGRGDFRYSITRNGWKLVLPDGKRAAELYDLNTDRSESNNVAPQNRERVAELIDQASRIIASGTSESGKTRANDTGYWSDLAWMTESEYDRRAGVAQK